MKYETERWVFGLTILMGLISSIMFIVYNAIIKTYDKSSISFSVIFFIIFLIISFLDYPLKYDMGVR